MRETSGATRVRPSSVDARWLLIVNIVLCACSAGWMVARASGASAPPVLALAPVPASARFWRRLSVAVAVVGVGSTLTIDAALAGSTGFVLAPPAAAVPVLVTAVVLAMWALLRLPMGIRTRRERARMVLDGLTVTAAAALALWHLALRPQLGGGSDVPALLGLLVLSVVALLSLVAVMKVVIEATLVCAAAHLQTRAVGPARARRGRRRDRPYSFLPYVAVAATDLLLIVGVVRQDEGLSVVVAGSVAVTAVVVVRQILSFHDNAQILSSVRDQEWQLRHQAGHDALTGLANRIHFAESVAAALAGLRSSGRTDRWNHPGRGPIPPAEFIPTAEHTGLIVPLGRWVLQEACRQAAAWRIQHGNSAPYSMNVNVAAWQLRDPTFLSGVTASLAAAGLPAQHLVIEVTETAALDDAQITATLHALRRIGVRLALDDFGTAASSLGLLLTCPVTTLKLDRSFVERITTVARQKAVATAVVHIADALDLHAVAEGIEDEEQARAVAALGYVEAQGYLFAKPLAATQVEDLLLRATAVPVGAGLRRSSW